MQPVSLNAQGEVKLHKGFGGKVGLGGNSREIYRVTLPQKLGPQPIGRHAPLLELL